MAIVSTEDFNQSMTETERNKWLEDFAACAQAYFDTDPNYTAAQMQAALADVRDQNSVGIIPEH